MSATIVKSIRISPEVWGAVEEEAGRRGVSANAFLVMCVNVVLAEKLPRMSDAEVGRVMAEISGPVAQRLERPPVERRVAGSTPAGVASVGKTESRAPVETDEGYKVAVGPVDRKPGSMLIDKTYRRKP